MASTVREAQAAPVQSESLKGWWRQFKRSDKKPQEQSGIEPDQGIFGIPLQTSIRYANVAISLFNDEGQSYIYGYVPIVVAKCGVFLKEKATDVEGIFRLAGSEKRIKELKVAFNSPDRYGKGLDWSGYTVHDAANVLRRYFNLLPEPIIPLEFYRRFREPLMNHQAQAVGEMDAQSPTIGDFDDKSAIRIYQALITELPPLNRQLLLYILDLLAVFASKSDLNKMTTPNLAAIFQPGLLSHPDHDMAPQEYRLSQDVLIFLIENQDSFLIGMPGTAADQGTVEEVSGGSPKTSTPSTPNRSKTLIGRSSSNASTAAGSRWGSIRRNASVSSRTSKRADAGPTPVGATGVPLTPSGSVHRSNTVPSRRAGSAAASPRYGREKHSDPSTPGRDTPPVLLADTLKRESSVQNTPIAAAGPGFPLSPPEIISASSSEATTPLATVASDTSSATTRDFRTPKRDTTPLLAPPVSINERNRSQDRQASTASTASAASGLLNIFKQSPGSDSDGRKPNKLQKKRIPGSSLSSAQSSTQSLGKEAQDALPRSPTTPMYTAQSQHEGNSYIDHPGSGPVSAAPAHSTPQRMPTDATLKPTISPSNSFHSHVSVTDQSDADMVGDDMPAGSNESPDKQKRRHRWRFSRGQNKYDGPASPPPASTPYSTMPPKENAMSRSTIGSSSAAGSQPRRSFQEAAPSGNYGNEQSPGMSRAAQVPSASQSAATDSSVFSDSEREKKGPMGWIRNKIHERKEKDAEKKSRTLSRPGGESKPDLRIPSQGQVEGLPVRGKSMDMQRSMNEGTGTVTPQGGVSSAGMGSAMGSAEGSAPTSRPLSQILDPQASVAAPGTSTVQRDGLDTVQEGKQAAP
ncbi:hypothetical protein B0A48_04289 [Cryoendolithus antarcticus]|uniref:Rho-GAP domain-containing protein n=1 Tax=Cryoendolithus antarcticus TaxID=1507870 RepID=A0A1V8TF81_9PEZI|nr:hypothetical protein B0A48_04289 [Cryoendolithus antarcticus]